MTYPTTWKEALQDPHVPIHWVLTLGRSGTTYYFADADLTISDRAYLGALRVSGRPSQEIDPYTGRASACTATVTLGALPEEPGDETSRRPYDIAAALNTSFSGFEATLSRWAEGTPEGELDVVLHGFASRPQVDGATGALTLHLEDWSVRYNTKFPTWRVDVEDYPNHRRGNGAAGSFGGDGGAGIPILYGAANGLECPCSTDQIRSGTASYFICFYGARVGAGYIYQGSGSFTANVTFSEWEDSHGNLLTIFSVPLGTDIGTDTYTFWGNGPADVSGQYTGQAGAALLNPIAQLWHLHCERGGIPTDWIDAGAWQEARNAYTSWATYFQLQPGDTSDLAAIREEFADPMGCAFFVEGKKLTVRRLDFDAEPVLNLSEGGNLLALTSYEPDDDTQLASKIELEYAWWWSFDDEALGYTQSGKRWSGNSQTMLAARELLGLRAGCEITKEFACRLFSSVTAANAVLDLKERLHGKPRGTVTLLADRESHTVRLYRNIAVTAARLASADGSGQTEKKYVVRRIGYGLTDNELVGLEA